MKLSSNFNMFAASLLLFSCKGSDWFTVFSIAKWRFEEIEQNVNNSIIVATKEMKSYLQCYLFCTYLEIPNIASLYFTLNTRICFCNSHLESSRSKNDTANLVIYGAPSFYIKKENHSVVNKTKITVWPYVQDCLDLYDHGYKNDAIYSITGWKGTPIYVNCDMMNGGWTVIQHRFNGSVNFNRNWVDYRLGFGEIIGEHWIGLENIYNLTKFNSSMSVYGEAFPGFEPANAISHFENFKVNDEESNFLIEASDDIHRYDCRYLHTNEFDGRIFSTPDKPNEYNCGSGYKSGWWFGGCGWINLNGPYFTVEEYEMPGNKYFGLQWGACWKFKTSLKSTCMKIRRESRP